jgi:hypothetical protein
MERIAVFTDQKGNMVNFYSCTRFQIFMKRDNNFIVEKTVSYAPIQSADTGSRDAVKDLTICLGTCKTVVFKEIAGIPYTVFDRERFLIFLTSDYSNETLNGILLDLDEMNKVQQLQQGLDEHTKPVETEIPGIYFLNLLQTQKAHPQLSTKDILLEFLQQTPFLELEIICEHVPPWILRDGKWKVQKQINKQGISARITNQQC